MPDNVRSVIAVDWSGAADDRGETVWLAHCVDGELVELRNGWRRVEIVDRVTTLATSYPGSVVGLDFSFGFPGWFAAERSWSTPVEMWADVRDSGEDWLGSCPLPFWGRRGHRRGPEEQFRVTEREVAQRWSVRPSSTFQIGGAGSVGTGSIRGMPHLLSLAEAGCSIWPFSSTSTTTSAHATPTATPTATVVEIYPRLLTGPVVKRRRSAREHVLATLPSLGGTHGTHRRLLELAGTSEDAFDAAVSAVRMHTYLSVGLRSLVTPPATRASTGIEGAIWEPPGRVTQGDCV